MRVRWNNGATNSYRMSKDGKYDLKLAPSEIPNKGEEEDKDTVEDTHIRDGRHCLHSCVKSCPLSDMSFIGKSKCLDVQVPEGVVAQCVLNLLRSLFLSTSLNSSILPMDTVSSVADFLRECLHCGMDETRAARTNRGRVSQMTNTLLSSLVFTRGVASLPTCGQAFCTWQWLSILLEIVERHLVLRGDQIATFITSKKKEPTRFLLDAVSGGGVLHCWSACVLICTFAVDSCPASATDCSPLVGERVQSNRPAEGSGAPPAPAWEGSTPVSHTSNEATWWR